MAGMLKFTKQCLLQGRVHEFQDLSQILRRHCNHTLENPLKYQGNHRGGQTAAALAMRRLSRIIRDIGKHFLLCGRVRLLRPAGDFGHDW